MHKREEVARKLQNMEKARRELVALEKALGELNPEERLVAEFLFLQPEKGNVQRLCQILQVEQSSVYRRRERVLDKLVQVLGDG